MASATAASPTKAELLAATRILTQRVSQLTQSVEVLLEGKDRTDVYLQAAAHQQNQLETYQFVVKNGGRCTGSAEVVKQGQRR